MGKRESGPIADRTTPGHLVYSGGLESDGVGGRGRCGTRRSRIVGEGLWPRGGNKR